ncbi:hypothetical protein M9Y10_023397 [Tritrichomonas musculus]|uniref:SP-RING-type domain-containing protein n=1 Tax=Tritrichomonas musculus TaxID=1915356 RepID=A0ABR2KUZ3_9EUKA
MSFSTQNHEYILSQLQECLKSCAGTWKSAEEQGLNDVVNKSKTTYSKIIDLQQDFQIYTDILRSTPEGVSYEEIENRVQMTKLNQQPFLNAEKSRMIQVQEQQLQQSIEENSGDEVEFEGGDTTAGLICPLTTRLPDDPVVSTICHHVYEKNAIYEYIGRQARVECPFAGCNALISRSTIITDPKITKKVNEARKLANKENGYEKL